MRLKKNIAYIFLLKLFRATNLRKISQECSNNTFIRKMHWLQVVEWCRTVKYLKSILYNLTYIRSSSENDESRNEFKTRILTYSYKIWTCKRIDRLSLVRPILAINNNFIGLEV